MYTGKDVKDVIRRLLRVQDIYLEMQELREKEREEKQNLNALKRTKSELEEKKERLKLELKDLRFNLKETEITIMEKVNRLNEIDKLISEAHHLKDIAMYEKEKGIVKGQLSQYEGEKKRLEQIIADKEYELEQTEAEISDMHKRIEEEEKRLEEDLKEVYAELDRLEKEKEEVYGELRPELRKYFEHLLEKRDGKAIVEAYEDSCGGCHIVLPASTREKLTRSVQVNEIMQCPNCFRFLYKREWIEEIEGAGGEEVESETDAVVEEEVA